MSIEMKTLEFDPAKGRDVYVTAHMLDFDPKAYKTKAGAAKAFHAAICKAAKSEGQNPDIEVRLMTPEESQAAGTGHNWRVIWEAGPFEWAIPVSMEMSGPWGYTEPYYSFDLCFTD